MMAHDLTAALFTVALDYPLAERLMSASVELALLAIAVAGAIAVFRMRSPRFVSILWLIVIVKPVLTLAFGALLPVFPIAFQAIGVGGVSYTEPGARTGIEIEKPGRQTPAFGSPAVAAESPGHAGQATMEERSSAAANIANWMPLMPHFERWRRIVFVALWAWGAGVVIMLLRTQLDRLRMHNLIARAARPTPGVAEALVRACEAVTIRRDGVPPVRITAALESPALVGWWRPTILLPVWLTAPDRRVALDWTLRHELTHLKHRDTLASGLRHLSEILFFFHPAVWWASRQWTLATELACDRALVQSEADVNEYAERLCEILALARRQRKHALSAGLFATRTQIQTRIHALLHTSLGVRDKLGALRALSLGILACATFAVGVFAVDRGREAVLNEVIPPGGERVPSLDPGLQARCEDLLEGQAGAIVVLNADTGAVLALASVPHAPFKEIIELEESGGPGTQPGEPRVRPRYMRAYQEQYPPGSIFKVVLAAAALEEDLITPDATYECSGGIRLPGTTRTAHCWKRSGHGAVDVADALAFSCDVFFYNIALELGVDKINEWAHRMGLGEPTGIDLPRETAGLIPGRAWKKKVLADRNPFDQNWFQGDTMNLSLGQGSAATTPLQNAVMIATVVNDGYRVIPQINGGNSPRGDRLLSDATLTTVCAGLRMAVEKAPPDYPAGTGWRAGVDGIDVIGKTGSAQIMSQAHHELYDTEDDIPHEFRDHAWFVAGVLDQEPRVAICILVEHGHHGSTAASALAKPVIEYLYGVGAVGNAASTLADPEDSALYANETEEGTPLLTNKPEKYRQSSLESGAAGLMVHFHSGLTQPADAVEELDQYYEIHYRNHSYAVRRELVRNIERRDTKGVRSEVFEPSDRANRQGAAPEQPERR